MTYPVCHCRPNSSASVSAIPSAEAPAPQAMDDARLSAIIVRGPKQTVFDLSSDFHPDVAEYGVMVPQSFVTATLCLRTLQGGLLG